MVDGSTDIFTNSHFFIYVKYCNKGVIKVFYLKLLQAEESNTIALYNIIINLLDKINAEGEDPDSILEDDNDDIKESADEILAP
ncbi:22368_t:CDS:2 [Entrophospora sp. SA101]|nr:22368_t:CDS:2 [Entrophospora sp. SA101]